MARPKQSLLIVLGLALLVAATGGAAPAARARDICVASPTGGGTFNTFIFRKVEPLIRGGVSSLDGLYFSTGGRKVAAVHGSAVMVSDGSIRVGFFVHSTAEALNDFTVAGIADTNLVGTLSYDNDGDFVPNGTLAMDAVDCASITIP